MIPVSLRAPGEQNGDCRHGHKAHGDLKRRNLPEIGVPKQSACVQKGLGSIKEFCYLVEDVDVDVLLLDDVLELVLLVVLLLRLKLKNRRPSGCPS